MKKQYALLTGALFLAMTAGPAVAKVSAQEAAELGKTLTPIGAEKAGNKEGTIPAWEPEPQRGALKGEFPNNPKIDAEKPLFTITKANMAKYEDKLTAGHKIGRASRRERVCQYVSISGEAE